VTRPSVPSAEPVPTPDRHACDHMHTDGRLNRPSDHRRPDDRTGIRANQTLSYQARERSSTAIVRGEVTPREETKLLIADHPKSPHRFPFARLVLRTRQRIHKQPRVTTAQSNRFDPDEAGGAPLIVLFSARSPCQETPVCGNAATRRPHVAFRLTLSSRELSRFPPPFSEFHYAVDPSPPSHPPCRKLSLARYALLRSARWSPGEAKCAAIVRRFRS
jgi:hypothetical protein